jgi:HSP20 family protein
MKGGRKMTDKNNKTTREVREEDLPVFSPATDIYENEKEITLTADMPGVDQANLDVTLEDNTLLITGKQNLEIPENLELTHKGYKTGIYKRGFSILADIENSLIKAKISDGVLKITMPKSEKTKPRKITVKAG